MLGRQLSRLPTELFDTTAKKGRRAAYDSAPALSVELSSRPRDELRYVARPALNTLHLLATTIAQRHARGNERNAADDEHLARKRGVVAGLGKRARRSLLLSGRGLCSSLRNLRLSLRLGLGMILVVLGLCSSQGVLGIAEFCNAAA